MTKVEVHYQLREPLREDQFDQIAWATSKYGLQAVIPNASLDALIVTYDASRLTLRDVEAALLAAGLPVELAS